MRSGILQKGLPAQQVNSSGLNTEVSAFVQTDQTSPAVGHLFVIQSVGYVTNKWLMDGWGLVHETNAHTHTGPPTRSPPPLPTMPPLTSSRT